MKNHHCTREESSDRSTPKTTAAKSGRWLSRLLGLSLVLLAWAESPQVIGKELLTDGHIANGVDAYPWGLPKEGQFDFQTGVAASWILTGWTTNAYDLYTSSTPHLLPSGATEWTNSHFSLTLGPDTNSQADIELGMNSYNIHGGNNPGAIASLFFIKAMTASPTLDEVTELDFNRDMKIIKEVLQSGDGVDPGDGGNGNSSWNDIIFVQGIVGGEKFSLNMHMYTDLLDPPGPSGLKVRWDTGTGKMDYRPGQVLFTPTRPVLNQWTYYRGDVLDQMKKAIDYGCTHILNGGTNALTKSNYSNYYVNSLAEDGFEATDLSNVKIRMANHHLYWGTNSGRTMLSVENADLGTLRNDFTGSVGEQVKVGSTTIVATSLGRWAFAATNSGTHTLKLVSSGGVDVPGGSVSLSMSGATAGDFKYANLAHPIALSGGATYYLVSSESGGGDQWYNWDTTVKPWVVYPTPAITIPGSVWYDTTYHTGGATNTTYGPVNMRYAYSFVQSTAMGTLLNNYTGYRGMEVVVGNTPITVTGLGRRNISGNTQNHILKVVDASTGADLAGSSVTWSPNGVVNGQNFVMLTKPVTLRANLHYYIVSQETSGGDQWGQGSDTTVNHTDVATVPNTVYGTGGVWTEGSLVDHCNGSVTFLYTSPQP